MITVQIDEDELLNMLMNRVKYWTDDDDTLELFEKFYENRINGGCFDGAELDIIMIVDNDYINNTSITTRNEDLPLYPRQPAPARRPAHAGVGVPAPARRLHALHPDGEQRLPYRARLPLLHCAGAPRRGGHRPRHGLPAPARRDGVRAHRLPRLPRGCAHPGLPRRFRAG